MCIFQAKGVGGPSQTLGKVVEELFSISLDLPLVSLSVKSFFFFDQHLQHFFSFSFFLVLNLTAMVPVPIGIVAQRARIGAACRTLVRMKNY